MIICVQLFSLFGLTIRETSLSSYLFNIKGELDKNFMCADVKGSNGIINNLHLTSGINASPQRHGGRPRRHTPALPHLVPSLPPPPEVPPGKARTATAAAGPSPRAAAATLLGGVVAWLGGDSAAWSGGIPVASAFTDDDDSGGAASPRRRRPCSLDRVLWSRAGPDGLGRAGGYWLLSLQASARLVFPAAGCRGGAGGRQDGGGLDLLLPAHGFRAL